ncbi:MAG: transglycosylase domain-containing protein [Clostridia bacterium]|nr:transglycosylase domain-containing protein [Clostridia bacterium]
MLKKVTRGIATFLLSLTLSFLILGSLGVVAGGIWAGTSLDTELDEELFFTGAVDRTTRLYYCDQEQNGDIKELSSDRISGYENALYCPLSEMSNDLKNAFIAIEDKRFFDHGGIDWLRTVSAVKDYLQKGEAHFGGSTITQQLVKNLTGDSERSPSRKVSELIRAAKLEKKMSKGQILEQYLNVVNLAQNCYGVRTAANAYFSKEPKGLTLGEAATIAAITNNPSRYDPIRHPAQNRMRRDVILSQMYEQRMISEAQYREAVSKDVELKVSKESLSGRVNSWFADLVVNDVIKALVAEKGMTEAAASRLVYCGGLKIYTTVDPRLQAEIEAFYRDPSNFPTHENGKKAQSAMMIVDPGNGDILAVVGAVGEKSSNRVQNYATDTKRPSGSVIKPLSVYAPAFQKGLITYATVFDDVPKQFRDNGAPWPKNSPNIYRGLTNINAALTHSVNTVSVSVLERLGTGNAYRFLTKELGFRSLDAVKDTGIAALALGQQHEGVSLSELVGGYTALANGGVYEGVRSFYKVVDSGDKVLLERERDEKRVLDAENAAIMTMLLRQVTANGTAKSITLKDKVDVAGKTGTSSNSCDKWFIGYTPELLAGVWYGYEYPDSLSDVKGNPALSIFDELMQRAIEIRGVKERQFDTPDNLVAVRYCRDSGKLLGDACRFDPRGDRSEVGYFKKGTEPTERCDCHICISYCEQGGVACENCPAESCHTTALLRVSRHFPRQIKVLDAPYTYGGAVPNKERILTNNEPYYAVNYQTKQNFGIGMDIVPYNRICPVHSLEDPFWSRRAVFSP